MSDENEVLLEETAENWIMEKCDAWRDHFESNYEQRFDEYNRLWRGIWAGCVFFIFNVTKSPTFMLCLYGFHCR